MTFAHGSAITKARTGRSDFIRCLLVPLGLLGFAVARRRPAVSAAVVALGAGRVILSTEPNARYLYAAMPLALIPAGAMLGVGGCASARCSTARCRALPGSRGCDGRVLPALGQLLPQGLRAASSPFSRADRGTTIWARTRPSAK